MPETSPRRVWTSRSVGSPLQHRIFYALIRLGGRRAAYALLHPVAGWYAAFRPSLWGRARPYLSRRFPGRRFPGTLADRYRLFLGLGKVLVDRATAGIIGPGSLSASLQGEEELLRTRDLGRGVVVVTAHVGSWQASMAALARFDRPVSLVIHRDAGDIDRHYHEHAGGEAPFRIIDPAGYLGGALEMTETLRQGGIVCLMGDRLFGDRAPSITVDFLGSPVDLPVAPYRLAAATGAPVAILLSRKSGPESYTLALVDGFDVPPLSDRNPERCRPYALRFVRALEEYIEREPYQFFNFFDLWGSRR
jgi:predicted LPLAT superfamily acyltransferase